MSKPRVELPEGCVPGKCYTGDPSIKICLPSCPEFPGDQLACPITLYRAHEGGICSAAAIAAFHAVDLVPYEPPKPTYEVEIADPQPVKCGDTFLWKEDGQIPYWRAWGAWYCYPSSKESQGRRSPSMEYCDELGWRLTKYADMQAAARETVIEIVRQHEADGGGQWLADTFDLMWYFWREVTA